MQNLYEKIRFLKLRKRLWRSWPYRTYVKSYEYFLKYLLKKNKANTKLIFINGMRRSGNHYLMKTLMDSSTSSVIFFNNQKKSTPLDAFNGLQVKYRLSKKILLIIGYEDLFIKDFFEASNHILETNFDGVEYLRLNIIRDVRNIMASRLNHAHMASNIRKDMSVVNTTKLLWIDHHENLEKNAWCNTIRYKHLIHDLNKLNLKSYFIDDLRTSTKVLSRYGGGSSFENQNFNSRFELFQDDSTYNLLIENLKALDERIHEPW